MSYGLKDSSSSEKERVLEAERQIYDREAMFLFNFNDLLPIAVPPSSWSLLPPGPRLQVRFRGVWDLCDPFITIPNMRFKAKQVLLLTIPFRKVPLLNKRKGDKKYFLLVLLISHFSG